MKYRFFYTLCGIVLFVPQGSYGQKSGLTPYRPYFNNQLKGWTRSFNNFSISSFKKEKLIAFEGLDYFDVEDAKEYYSIYKRAWSFSPDKNQFIDIYSYWLNLEQEGKRIVSRGGEPDQGITLCNFKAKKWERIYFQGTTERIQDIQWVTNSKFIMVGFREGKDGRHYPMIYLGNTVTRAFESFAPDDKKSFQKRAGYDSPKLLRLHIKQL